MMTSLQGMDEQREPLLRVYNDTTPQTNIHRDIHTGRQTDSLPEEQLDVWNDRPPAFRADIHTDTHTDIHTDILTDTHTDIHIEMDSDAQTDSQTKVDKQADRSTDTKTDTQRKTPARRHTSMSDVKVDIANNNTTFTKGLSAAHTSLLRHHVLRGII